MPIIHVLSEETINKIAAGEVVERPAGVVKELVENAIDAGSTAITVEIKDGGTSFIRVTDNGCGIDKDDITSAFLRHATSKISVADDLISVRSMGFRGEALSSVAAVASVELMTKTADDIIGHYYSIEGSKEIERKDMGIPGGTTIIVRNLFFNTPARKKFLKSSITEGGYVADVLEHLALANPSISIKFISAGQIKFHTSGNGDVKELIYRLFGRESAQLLIPIEQRAGDISISGYLGKPELNRSTRNYENYFINGRYVRSDVISKATEEGYKEYLMQHRFPFYVIYIDMPPERVDVNVHPGKMEVRFDDNDAVYDMISSAVHSTLRVKEMIPETLLNEPDPIDEPTTSTTEPFEAKRATEEIRTSSIDIRRILGEPVPGKAPYPEAPVSSEPVNVIKASDAVIVNAAVQMEMFEDKLLDKDAVADYKIIGQIFDTFWLFEYKDRLLVMDQHAAHEKVKYERLIGRLKSKENMSQMLAPAIVITLTPTELDTLKKYRESFITLGYEFEEFGGYDISLRAVPMDLYGSDPKSLFLDVLDELSDGRISDVPEVINDRIATMACKSAVKGNMSMTVEEVKELLREMLGLDNPYNCPHGRPTLITMTKYEFEKRFKRIV